MEVSTRLTLRTTLGKLDKLGEAYKIPFDVAAKAANTRVSRERFESLIGTVEDDKLDVLQIVLDTWADLIRTAASQRNMMLGNTPKSGAPQKNPVLVEAATAQFLGLTDTESTAMLEQHNELRKLYQAGPLKDDSVLASEAQAWANQLATGYNRWKEPNFAAHNQVRTADGFNGNTGENVYRWPVPSPSYDEPDHTKPVVDWGDENKNWNFTDHQPRDSRKQYLHFTQLVWKGTTHVGCGYTQIRIDGKCYLVWVCNYPPAGNVTGEFPKNVLPRK